ncbi:hypothetical protein MPSEU_000546100 [Mayamaea pseudoterrestris]|nr:hypothetical protein MPSEU_000546100 [Mayamaea pseudoterrestris]
MMKQQTNRNACILNVGYYRTGSATLAKAAELVGLKVHSCSNHLMDDDDKDENVTGTESLKTLLLDPLQAVTKWWNQDNGKQEMERLVQESDFVYGGFVPWLVMLPDKAFDTFCNDMKDKHGVSIQLVATRRHLSTFLKSELHQWVIHDLERKAGLDVTERSNLVDLLSTRALMHAAAVEMYTAESLLLEEMDHWPKKLAKLFAASADVKETAWADALLQAGKQNESPKLPLQGVLLALQHQDSESSTEQVFQQVDELLQSLKQDGLCNMIIVLGVDGDSVGKPTIDSLVEHIQESVPVFLATANTKTTDEDSSSSVCRLWDSMAVVAFDNGADWVTPLELGDKIDCSFHYRAFYRAFLDVSERLQCPLGFGCVWWSDKKGKRAAPVIGRSHYEIFSGLIAVNRWGACNNKDFLLYLHKMYLRFEASILVQEAVLKTAQEISDDIPIVEVEPSSRSVNGWLDWRDWLIEDVQPVRKFLSAFSNAELLLLDVVIPTYRVDMCYLERMCKLKVPAGLRTTFIIVVDNPNKLQKMFKAADSQEAAHVMEQHLKEVSGNNICVRCNPVNSGAPATRNRGLDESAADYILLLDDDVIPEDDLLFEYEKVLRTCDDSVVGLVGMVQFPRRPDLPMIHAAALTCPLTGMFEIASHSSFEYPAWGITANLLIKRTKTRFDLAYTAGEDVDLCLRIAKETGGKFMSAPSAKVMHDYWPGGFFAIIHHFYKWALGDGVLFSRHPHNTYKSWPNCVEFATVFLSLWLPFLIVRHLSPLSLLFQLLGLFMVDLSVDLSDRAECEQRQTLIQHKFPWWYYILAQAISNLYVIGFEIGRLVGNWSRGDVLRNACTRYEWQCGRIPNLRANVQVIDLFLHVEFEGNRD